VNAFDTAGNLLRRVASRPAQLAVGLALAPADFGSSAATCSSHFGNGRITPSTPLSYRAERVQRRGPLHSADGSPIAVDGLWAIASAAAAPHGPTTPLLHAGPGGEHHGLFGTLVVAASPTATSGRQGGG